MFLNQQNQLAIMIFENPQTGKKCRFRPQKNDVLIVEMQNGKPLQIMFIRSGTHLTVLSNGDNKILCCGSFQEVTGLTIFLERIFSIELKLKTPASNLSPHYRYSVHIPKLT